LKALSAAYYHMITTGQPASFGQKSTQIFSAD
jgi:hypothetical protein